MVGSLGEIFVTRGGILEVWSLVVYDGGALPFWSSGGTLTHFQISSLFPFSFSFSLFPPRLPADSQPARPIPRWAVNSFSSLVNPESKIQSPGIQMMCSPPMLLSRLCCVKPSSACLLPPKEFGPYSSKFLSVSSLFLFFFLSSLFFFFPLQPPLDHPPRHLTRLLPYSLTPNFEVYARLIYPELGRKSSKLNSNLGSVAHFPLNLLMARRRTF